MRRRNRWSGRVSTPKQLGWDCDRWMLRNMLASFEVDLRYLTREVAALRAAIPIRKELERKWKAETGSIRLTVAKANPKKSRVVRPGSVA